MASFEKKMIPLEAISQTNEGFDGQMTSKELVDVKIPSRPRRRVVIVAGVIAVLTVVIVAASLIGKYVPEYIRDASSYAEKGSKDKGIGKREGGILSSSSVTTISSVLTETKPSTKAASSDFQKGQTSPLQRVTFLSSTETTSSSSETATTTSKEREGMLESSAADQTAIASLVTNTAATSSLRKVIKPSAKATSSDFQQGQTSSLPPKTSFTSAAATSSMSEAPSIFSTMSEIRLASSVADVAVIANLVYNTESKWTRWSAWTDCTKTCGTGTRQRNRTCAATNQRAVLAPISCAGKSQQVKSCAEWNCPDCSKNCSIGTLNAACDACTCAHHSLTGRVLTETDVPLSEANVSLAETPYNVLAQTNVSGYFSTIGLCADNQLELLITKVGFVPVKQKANVLTPTTATITAKMEIAVAPFVTVHPDNKIRMPGQSVTFCCDGQGNPPPEIEWFKENNIIDKDLYNYDKVLEIPDVTGLNGSFSCRVVNQFGAEFSTPAELTVFEKSVDSCSLTPSSKNETLPAGCVLNGTNNTIVDVGECEPVSCVKRNSSFNSSCTEPSMCCGPRSFESVLVQCGALMSFNLSIVKTCGCGNCMVKQTVIEGKVVGQDDSAAILVELIFGGELVDRTDANGLFSFRVPKNTKRAVVTFKDRIIKKFEEEDKIFVLNDGQTVTYRVKLREKPKPITFNASEPLDLPLGGESDSFADLEIPENALLTEDGSVFSGNAKASVSVTDPRNQSDILSAPGDFSTMNEDGEEEILETYGMIKLSLEDDNGKPLVMSKPMKVYLDPEKLNLTLSDGNVSIKLYWLDRKTGRWRAVGDFALEDGSKRRRKRSSHRVFLAGTVTPAIAKEDLNFDMPTERVGLRVTTNPEKDGVTITAIRKDHQGYVERITQNGVTCMPIWKDKWYYLQAEMNFKYYDPDPALTPFSTTFQHVQGDVKEISGDGKTISSFEFYSGLVNQPGPIYFDDGRGGSQMTTCRQSLNSAQSQPPGSQFVFKEPQTTSDEYALLSTPVDLASNWWSEEDFETCFIKVTIRGTNVLFMAASYKKDDQTNAGKYGFHLRMPRSPTSGSDYVVCLQFRCPRENDHTALLLTPMTSEATCTITQMDTDLVSPQASSQKCPGSLPLSKGQEKWLCIPWSDSELYSTYKGLEKNGEARCLRSNQRDGGTDTTTKILPTKFSVKYDCS